MYEIWQARCAGAFSLQHSARERIRGFVFAEVGAPRCGLIKLVPSAVPAVPSTAPTAGFTVGAAYFLNVESDNGDSRYGIDPERTDEVICD